jgi:prepilin-type N-terminal cleavage/methylation domain-containing protein
MKLKNPNANNFGFSLAEVMVALGISGFLLLVVNQVLSDVNKWMADISVDSELVEISQLISARV